jgi:hypothetical protein
LKVSVFFSCFQNHVDKLQLVVLGFSHCSYIRNQDDELHSLSWFFFYVANFETTTTSVVLIIVVFSLLFNLEDQDDKHNL